MLVVSRRFSRAANVEAVTLAWSLGQPHLLVVTYACCGARAARRRHEVLVVLKRGQDLEVPERERAPAFIALPLHRHVRHARLAAFALSEPCYCDVLAFGHSSVSNHAARTLHRHVPRVKARCLPL
jgi:hypothetical protein